MTAPTGAQRRRFLRSQARLLTTERRAERTRFVRSSAVVTLPVTQTRPVRPAKRTVGPAMIASRPMRFATALMTIAMATPMATSVMTAWARTVDVCEGAAGCTNALAEDYCVIDDVCYPNEGVNPEPMRVLPTFCVDHRVVDSQRRDL